MWTKTLRGRLTLWNLGVLTLTLILFGLVLNFTNRQRLNAEINQDVLERARHAANPPPPPPGAPPGMGFDRGPGPDGGPPGDDFQDMGGPPGGRPGPGSGAAPQPNDPLGDLHRPQRFSREGRLLGPPGREPFDKSLLAMALKGITTVGDTHQDGIHLRVAAAPVEHDGQVDGAIETARDLTDYDALLQSQTITLLILVPLALLVSGMGAMFLTNKALKPIATATETAEHISEQEMSTRLDVQGADELAKLSGTFNGMLDRLQASFEKQKAAYAALEKAYENQRRFTADASHELRTPLTRLKLATGAALTEAGTPPTVLESLKIADQSVDSMSKIVNQLLLLAKADAGQLGLALAPLDLRLVAAEAADSMPPRQPALVVDLADTPVVVNGDEDHLKRVILNLLQNAYRYTPGGKKVSISVAAKDGQAVLRVEDEGIGVSPEHLPRLGERFYRVDVARSQAEGGVGLGLSICKSIVEAHGGEIKITSTEGKGTSVAVRIPLQRG